MPRSVRNHPATSTVRLLLLAAALTGVALLALNTYGLLVPLRAVDIDGYRDFAGGETLPFDTTIARLEALQESAGDTAELVDGATRIFHEGIAHVARQDILARGLDHYRMRVPASENWILYTLSFLKPDTYLDYEFCNYRRALSRGTGRCGQQSLALVSFLTERGLETGFVALGGHAIATARVDDRGWFLLDPDYGGVIPFDIAQAEADPESVLPYYWSEAARNNAIHLRYAPENDVRYGGPEARYARACPIETAAYALKWLLPVLLLLPAVAFAQTTRRRPRAHQP